MLVQLEEFGWIERYEDRNDRRTKYVRLTDLGLSIIWRAMRRVFRGRTLLSRWEALPTIHAEHSLTKVDRVLYELENIERHLGGRSDLPYAFGLPLD